MAGTAVKLRKHPKTEELKILRFEFRKTSLSHYPKNQTLSQKNFATTILGPVSTAWGSFHPTLYSSGLLLQFLHSPQFLHSWHFVHSWRNNFTRANTIFARAQLANIGYLFERKFLKNMAQNKNIGAKVLSSRFVKELNLLITSLTSCLCTAREHVPRSREIRQR